MSNLKDADNKYKNEYKVYKAEELNECAICFKSVDYDINHTDLLINMYPDLYFIGLTRNGYALADGHIRRGSTAKDFGRLYNEIASKMKTYSKNLANFKLVKFEDVLERPFEVAEDLFEFTDTHPTELEKLRLKSKKITTEGGQHKVSFGTEHRKYWFDKTTIFDLLDPSINSRQRDNINPDVIKTFNSEASSALDYFGYEIQ